jgi:lactate dehydrogenase-like 2-hydroxyacid dehydrogenase
MGVAKYPLLLPRADLFPLAVDALVERYDVVKLWEQPDPDAYLAREGARFRAVAGSGIRGKTPALDTALADKLPNLGLVAVISAGYEGVEPGPLRARGIEVTNAGPATRDDVADFAVGAMIAMIRGIVPEQAVLRAGEWRERRPIRTSIRTLRAGILGLGAIGEGIAERLVPMRCPISYWSRTPKETPFRRAESFEALVKESEILFLALRADDSNVGLIDARVLDMLGPNGYLINISRGTVINEPDLREALKAGRIAGAALDVFQQEPIPDPKVWEGVPNTLLTPHIAGVVSANFQAVTDMMIANLDKFFAGEKVLTPVP